MKKSFIATLFVTIFLALSLQATSHPQNTINLKTINGKNINVKITDNGFIFEQYKGKTVMLDFFGPSCPPCLIEIPHLVELQAEEKSKLQIIGVQVQRTMSDADLNRFKQSKNINYDIVNLEHAMELVHFVQANTGWKGQIPFVLMFDKNGALKNQYLGMTNKSKFLRDLNN
jgi:thiol-disulfide isomerase/thioredoxin